jgi:RNA polymerase sigma-70 factor (ECF subfamily)
LPGDAGTFLNSIDPRSHRDIICCFSGKNATSHLHSQNLPEYGDFHVTNTVALATPSRVSILETDFQNDEHAAAADLVRRAQGGDVDAFTELVKKYHRLVASRVRGTLGDAGLTEEVTQEVFLVAYQSLERFAWQSDFGTWLLGIARNKAISALRSEIARRRHERSPLLQKLAELRLERLNQTNDQQQTAQIQTLRECLEKLKPEHRTLLDRHYKHNETAESIARDQQRSSSGVRMLFLRLRQALHECIQRKLNE